MSDGGRSFWAALHLLDRQILDAEGAPLAKVDDLELTAADDPDGLPIVTDILCGQAALARRFNPRLSRGIELLRRVVRPDAEPGPARISFGSVKFIGPHVAVTLRRDEVDVTVVDRWLAREVLSHIPGSGASGVETRP